MTENQPPGSLLTRAVAGKDRRAVFARYGDRPSYSFRERALRYTLRSLAYLTILITTLIIVILLVDSVRFFQMASLLEFFTGTRWEPFGSPKHLGILPLLSGSLMVSLGSLLVCVPFGFGSAIFLTMYASRRTQAVVSPIVEILGGIPTVVYGYFAITAVSPWLANFFPQIDIFNALSASIVVGISILPTVSSLSSDAIRAVPKSIQSAGYAIGMSKFHVVVKVTLPAAISGIVASFILAFARAIGETMAVSLAAGSTPNMNWNYLSSIQTMTAFIVQISMVDTPAGSLEYYTIYAVGLTLFAITFAFNFAAYRFVKRFREVYR